MKNFKKSAIFMPMLASILFFSCSNDEEEKLSKEVTKAEITQLSADLSDKFTEMEQSEGMLAMEALMNLDFPFVSAKSDQKSEVLNNMQKYLLPYNYIKKNNEKSALEAESFDFEFWWGTYTWDEEHSKWKVVFDNPDITTDDKIVILFPADTTDMTNNNAKASLYNYEEELIDGEFMPSIIDADLFVDEIKLIDINLTAEWFTTGEYMGEPTSLDVSVYLIPFEFTGDFDHSSVAASINLKILDDGAQFFSAGLGAKWANEGDSIPSNINGYLQLFEVKFQADVNLLELMMMTESDEIQEHASLDELINAVNEKINTYVSVNGTWAADIKLSLVPYVNDDGEADLKLDLLFVYDDGTSESATPYFEDLENDLSAFFGELEEYYSGW